MRTVKGKDLRLLKRTGTHKENQRVLKKIENYKKGSVTVIEDRNSLKGNYERFGSVKDLKLF